MVETKYVDINGNPICIGDRAYYIGEDDGEKYSGTIQIIKLEIPEDWDENDGMDIFNEDHVCFVYDDPPKCQDEFEFVFIDSVLDKIILEKDL